MSDPNTGFCFPIQNEFGDAGRPDVDGDAGGPDGDGDAGGPDGDGDAGGPDVDGDASVVLHLPFHLMFFFNSSGKSVQNF